MEVIDRVIQWHRDRNLIDGSDDETQVKKLLEEVIELTLDIKNSKPLLDELGDCLVVLVNIAERNGFTLEEALEFSYNKIKDRKGRMVDGFFVKEEDLK